MAGAAERAVDLLWAGSLKVPCHCWLGCEGRRGGTMQYLLPICTYLFVNRSLGILQKASLVLPSCAYSIFGTD